MGVNVTVADGGPSPTELEASTLRGERELLCIIFHPLHAAHTTKSLCEVPIQRLIWTRSHMLAIVKGNTQVQQLFGHTVVM